jgi:hypothetical protein
LNFLAKRIDMLWRAWSMMMLVISDWHMAAFSAIEGHFL